MPEIELGQGGCRTGGALESTGTRRLVVTLMVLKEWIPIVMRTWTPKVCRVMAFMAIIMGLRLLSYILLGFRYTYNLHIYPYNGTHIHSLTNLKHQQGYEGVRFCVSSQELPRGPPQDF